MAFQKKSVFSVFFFQPKYLGGGFPFGFRFEIAEFLIDKSWNLHITFIYWKEKSKFRKPHFDLYIFITRLWDVHRDSFTKFRWHDLQPGCWVSLLFVSITLSSPQDFIPQAVFCQAQASHACYRGEDCQWWRHQDSHQPSELKDNIKNCWFLHGAVGRRSQKVTPE